MKWQSDTGTYTLQKAKKRSFGNIPTVGRSLECLHSNQIALQTYQKPITLLRTQYKFNAVYLYDINFRTLVAAERSEAPEHRTLTWGVRHEELACCHLTTEIRLPPTKCFNCN